MDQADSNSLSSFLDQLLVTKHGDGLTDESKQEMKADLMPRLERFITVKTMELLVQVSPTYVDEFMTMMEAKKPMEEVQKYVEGKIPDYTAHLATILLEFQSLYIGKEPQQTIQ